MGTMAEVAGGASVGRACGLVLIILAIALAVGAEPPPKADASLSREQAERLLATEVLPLLKEKCVACHGEDPKGPRSGLDLRSRETALASSRAGNNPVDAFILAKLQSAGLTPTPEADRRTLIRRVTFDLTGLPPMPEAIDAFLADDRPDAYERLVDRLLASPQYGEQQARHWLDVTRYADSAGFSNDFERPHAWRYRDYVVRSFNADKPFDRFVLEQLAGDELAPDDAEMLIAVGFLRMGPWEHTAMSVATVTRQQWLDDVTNAVGETFLAAPLACCRCHDHKFDPLPTRDYYRVQAVFAPV